MPIKVGKVRYIDFAKGFAGIHERIFVKRKSLSHEAEVRVVMQEFQPTSKVGKDVSVDLRTLLALIAPSPFAPSWFTPLLDATLRRYGVNAPLRSSEILAEPFF